MDRHLLAGRRIECLGHGAGGRCAPTGVSVRFHSASQCERSFSIMSLPSFPNVDPAIQREDAVNQILSSIAMEELGMSHILNAEGRAGL